MDKQIIWQKCKDILVYIMPPDSYRVWVAPLADVSTTHADNALAVYVPNVLFRQHLADELMDYFRQALAMVNKELESPIEAIDFVVLDKKSHADDAAKTPETHFWRKSHINEQTGIDSRYTFANFVVGEANSFAFEVAYRLAEQLHANEEAPLWLCGISGMGKTHLLYAIGNHVLARHPRARVALIRAKQFVRQMTAAIRDHSIDEFITFFEELDVFLLDDTHLISGKERTQEELYGIYERMRSFNGQMVLASDQYPNEMENVSPRLKSRVQQGTIAFIAAPDYETRVGILKEFARRNDVIDKIHDDAFEYLAAKFPISPRKLEGILKTVKAGLAFGGIRLPASLADVKDIVRKKVGPAHTVDVGGIQQTVASFYNLRVDELNAGSRKQRVVRPRQMAMYLAREMTDLSYPEIGRAFGGRDHTAVINACKRIAEYLQDDRYAKLQEDARRIRSILQS